MVHLFLKYGNVSLKNWKNVHWKVKLSLGDGIMDKYYSVKYLLNALFQIPHNVL